MSEAPASATLDYLLHRPESAADGSVVTVLLHGRGSNRRDLQGLVPLLPQAWTVVTPEAPFAGSAWGYGPGSAWYRYVSDDRVVEETLNESLSKLERFLAELPDVVGFRPGGVVLGGFSQGGTVSLAYALSRPGSVDAVLNFSGFLVASALPDASAGPPPPTPIFWGHGVEDPAIPISLAEKGPCATEARRRRPHRARLHHRPLDRGGGSREGRRDGGGGGQLGAPRRGSVPRTLQLLRKRQQRDDRVVPLSTGERDHDVLALGGPEQASADRGRERDPDPHRGR